ncbi:hypothetical protein [Frigidibacter sp. MR17.24]|uniref:hypothetical protein n=1 Tax=Frigidibacter sp. MR17.24 TaxID=3127345 RepID=UPI00301301EA
MIRPMLPSWLPAPGWLPDLFLLSGLLWLLAWAGGALAQPAPREVRTGAFVTSLHAIDPGDGSFGLSGYVWFSDPGGSFDPAHDMEILAREVVVTPFVRSRRPDGSVYAVVAFRVVVDHAFDLRRYPFDRQHLSLPIEAAETADRIVLVPDRADSVISDEVHLPGWRIGALALGAAERRYDTGFGHRAGQPAFSRVTLGIGIDRRVSPLLFEKFTGFFVALVIAGLTLLVPVEELGTRIGMTTGAIFAAVFNRYRFEDAIGFDASFGTVDQVTFLTFSMILGMLLLSLLSHRARRRAEPGAPARAVARRDARRGGVIAAAHLLALAAVFAVALR